VALGTNVIGARTVESILVLYPNKVTRKLRMEFYGKKFTILMAEPPQSLRELLANCEGKEHSVLDHMRDLVQKFVNKGLLEFKFVHELVWEYCKEVKGDEKRMEDLSQQLLDAAPKLISTKAGARTICEVAAHCGAKERKRLLKVRSYAILCYMLSIVYFYHPYIYVYLSFSY